MNIFQRLSKARLLLSQCEITKSGLNKHSNYTYYELDDFMPSILRINDEIGVCPVITYEDGLAVLTLYNSEKPEELIRFTFKLKDIVLPACNAMQSEGGKNTYAKRYLYKDAYEVAEADPSETPEATDHAQKTQATLKKEIVDAKASLTKSTKEAGFTIESVIKSYNKEQKKDAKTLDDIPVKMLVGYDQRMLVTIRAKAAEAKRALAKKVE